MFVTKYLAMLSRYDEKDDIIRYLRFCPLQSLPQLSIDDDNFFFFINSESVAANFLLNSVESANCSEFGLPFYKTESDFFNFFPEPISENSSFSDDFLTKYVDKKKFTFTNFFVNNLIDVPICFKKSRSLYRSVFSSPIFKFSNYFMRCGRKEKSLKLMLKILKKLSKNYFKNKPNSPLFIQNWFYFYLICGETFFHEFASPAFFYFIDFDSNPASSSKIEVAGSQDELKNKEKIATPDSLEITLKNSGVHLNDGKEVNLSFFYKNLLNQIFFKINPIFSFFIYNVDKNIRKFSRGKSGKYTFLWKYIAPHKRHYLVMRLLAKDSKFYPHKKFLERILQTFLNLLFNVNESYVNRSKIFSHNYVFKNFKKTLLSNFKTST